jgi:hypothetical protein
MNRLAFALPFATLLLLGGPASAEPDSERQLTELQAEHRKALAAAVEPVNRRYAAALEQLLRHATLSNDIASAVKIKAEMDTLSDGSESLAVLIADSRWTWFEGANFTGIAGWVEFYKNGTASASWRNQLRWKLDGNNLSVRNVTADSGVWHFTMNLANKQGLGDAATSNNHEERSIRFERHVPHTANAGN